MFFCLDYPVHRWLTQLPVVQRQQAFDHRHVLLADGPLGAFRRHRVSVFERRFSLFATLKGHLTKPHALKVVGHIDKETTLEAEIEFLQERMAQGGDWRAFRKEIALRALLASFAQFCS